MSSERRSSRDGLTKKTREVYAVVVALLEAKRYPPTRSELAREVKLSPTRIQHHIERLVAEGYLGYEPGTPRSLHILKPLPQANSRNDMP